MTTKHALRDPHCAWPDWLRDRSAALGLSGRALSRAAGFASMQWLAKVRRGERFPSRDELQSLAHVLQLSSNELRALELHIEYARLARLTKTDLDVVALEHRLACLPWGGGTSTCVCIPHGFADGRRALASLLGHLLQTSLPNIRDRDAMSRWVGMTQATHASAWAEGREWLSSIPGLLSRQRQPLGVLVELYPHAREPANARSYAPRSDGLELVYAHDSPWDYLLAWHRQDEEHGWKSLCDGAGLAESTLHRAKKNARMSERMALAVASYLMESEFDQEDAEFFCLLAEYQRASSSRKPDLHAEIHRRRHKALLRYGRMSTELLGNTDALVLAELATCISLSRSGGDVAPWLVPERRMDEIENALELLIERKVLNVEVGGALRGRQALQRQGAPRPGEVVDAYLAYHAGVLSSSIERLLNPVVAELGTFLAFQVEGAGGGGGAHCSLKDEVHSVLDEAAQILDPGTVPRTCVLQFSLRTLPARDPAWIAFAGAVGLA